MHEMSIALEVARIVESNLQPERLPDVIVVRLEVGDEAGVEFSSLQSSLEVVLTSPPFDHGRAEIVRVEGDVLHVSQVELRDASPHD